ncbi:phosphatase PAP2 family protein [Streptomyces genisteinicus]|uniref:Phosphatase PAP2 family protein n=1 Tax=Streptomyces genisteinicus TaxID=2768068 RepID=A0A7H0HND0_9ACTN|nr:phosphatase PAP2 family protein [Streptomyces genisteinicus]QNP62046.1 phosphatase PAP2 family protein [Streptomyces genisteinicus]
MPSPEPHESPEHPDSPETSRRPGAVTGAGATRRTRTASLAGSVLLAASALLTVLVVTAWEPLLAFDRSVTEDLHRSAVSEPAATRANRILTDWVWDPWTMRLLAAAVTVWLWRRGDRLLAVWIAGASALGAALQQTLKALVGRDRPQWPDPVDTAQFAAFPSGHAMTATLTCGLLLWLLHRDGVRGRARAWAVALAAVSVAGVGFTRVYLGVHWPSDVLGGWLLGAAVVAVAAASYERALAARRAKAAEEGRAVAAGPGGG